MKLLVIGCGQCGGRIADEFARLNVKTRVQRGINIITDTFAVNTDIADLSGLSFIKSDYEHRILLGGQKTSGHGVGKINELGAEIAREDGDKVVGATKPAPRFAETDAFLLIASAAGGTGSGMVPVLSRYLKECYAEKPLYNLVILPFQHEEATEQRSIYNTATCLKSVYLVSDAIVLVDNQRFVRKDSSIRSNMDKINTQVVEPFYNLLCAWEESEGEMRALVLMETTVGKVKEVTTVLKQLDEVKSVDVVTGSYDIVAVIEAEDLTAIGHTVTAKIKAVSGVSRALACTT